LEELKTTELEDYVDLFREFETKKRSIITNQQNKVVITLPLSLTTLAGTTIRGDNFLYCAIELMLMDSNVRSST
jgi:hypothetical protein